MSDPYIGKALQLIHEHPQRPWTLAELGRTAFSARFTRLIGQPAHRYLVARRMDEAALMIETSDDAIDRPRESGTRRPQRSPRPSASITASRPAVTGSAKRQ